MALDGLETQPKQHLGVTKARKLKVNVVRYADDFVITGESKEMLENEVRPWVEQFFSKKYFRTVGERNWVFGTQIWDTKRGRRDIDLYELASTAIERHKKVSGCYNPFDPSMEAMGEKLRMERMMKNLKYQKQILSLPLITPQLGAKPLAQ